VKEYDQLHWIVTSPTNEIFWKGDNAEPSIAVDGGISIGIVGGPGAFQWKVTWVPGIQSQLSHDRFPSIPDAKFALNRFLRDRLAKLADDAAPDAKSDMF